MRIIKKFRELYKNQDISVKITLIHTICFVAALCAINFAIWFGTSYALYEPAKKSIEYSMKNVQDILTNLAEDVADFNPNAIHEPLVAGVVLRVVNENGIVFIDTDPTYPANENFEENILTDPPYFADNDMDIALIEGRALVYRARMDYFYGGEHVILYFFRTITSMKDFFNDLAYFLIFLDLFGIIFGVGAGIFVSRKVLNPIKTMTYMAKNIAYGRMDGRIPISPANDELTELAKTLNEMLDRLQGGISRQQKFVSDASHELRTPATVIAGYIEILEKYSDDKALFNESVEAIRSEAQNMKNLLESLLFLARTDQKRQTLNKEKFDLSNVIDDIVHKMKKIVTTHEIILSGNDFAMIYGDITRIKQMIRIFLDNAMKYTPAGGKISVSSKVDGDFVFVKISDTGIGIAPENLPKIFERFFRIDSEKIVKAANGSGLGLPIAKWIADNHNIKIIVESEIGKGTTFTLQIERLS